MRAVAELLNEMVDAGVIGSYAVFGAVAQMRYTEAVATLDADVLVTLPGSVTLDVLKPIYAFCAQRGYAPEKEAIRIGDWPVQFIPAFSPLTEEAIREAEVGDIEGVPFRVVDATHLAVIALSVGRAKDHSRILALLESGAVKAPGVEQLAGRHGLSAQWRRFREHYLDA